MGDEMTSANPPAEERPRRGRPPAKWLWLAGLAAGGLLILVLASYALSLTKQDLVWKRIQERKVFTVVTDASYPPFAAIDVNGTLFGFDIDLAEAIGRQWGVKVEFETLAYDALLGAVISGRDDAVISAFVPQPDRLKEVTFSPPYFTGGTVVVVRAGAAGAGAGAGATASAAASAAQVKDWKTGGAAWAAGKTLAVERGAGGDALARQWARRAAGLTVLSKPTAEDALLAVEDQSADAALVDELDAYNFLLGHPSLTLVQPPVDPEPYTVAVGARNRVLAQEVEKALQALAADGTLSALRVKWFGEAAR